MRQSRTKITVYGKGKCLLKIIAVLFFILGCVPVQEQAIKKDSAESAPVTTKQDTASLKQSWLRERELMQKEGASDSGDTGKTSLSSSNIPKKMTENEVNKQNISKQDGWAVIVGISKYLYTGKNNLTDLIYADADAKAFAGILKKLGWSESHIRLLVNEEATHRNVMIAMDSWLTKAKQDDLIVFYWSGHGYPDPEDPEKVYFACYDTDLSIPATGYRMDHVRRSLEEKKTKNVVMFGDTCHAGKLITRGEKGIAIVPQIDKMKRDQNIPKGWVFMVGADSDRLAIEHSSWSNGAFTHALIKGLEGAADGYMGSGLKDNIVTLGELRSYMMSVMPEETQKVLGVAKHPIITTSSGDPTIWDILLNLK